MKRRCGGGRKQEKKCVGGVVLVYLQKWHSTAAWVKDLPRGFTQQCKCNQPSQCATTVAADTSLRQWHPAFPSILNANNIPSYHPTFSTPVRPRWSTAEVRLYIHVCLKKIRKQTAEPFIIFFFYPVTNSHGGKHFFFFAARDMLPEIWKTGNPGSLDSRLN